MGARSGGGAGGGSYGGYSSARARDLAGKYLGDVKNPELKKQLAEGLAEFDKEFGIPDRVTVTMKDLGSGTYGQIYTKSGRIEISTRYEDGRFNISHAKHTMIHELAHSIDKTLDKTVEVKGYRVMRKVKPENKVFDKKLMGAYKTFKLNYGSPATKQIGGYALTNRNEFFADAVAHHMTGTKNQYSTFAFNLAKSMTGK
jgi:hypothetical protein